MEDSKREELKNRLLDMVVNEPRLESMPPITMAEVMVNSINKPNLDPLLDFISQELDKAREEGRREYFSMGMEYFSLIEDSNIYQQKGWKLPEEKTKRLQILDNIFNLILKTKEDERDNRIQNTY